MNSFRKYMCRLVESIKIKDGKIYNIDYHNNRLNAARRALWGCKEILDVKTVINGEKTSGLVKCRVIYDNEIKEVQYVPYQLPAIHSLKIIEDNGVEYGYKYENRQQLNALYEKREDADDILIVKNGWVTDSYFCNVVFEKDKELFTPSSCLLKGTKRQKLLNEKRITETAIRAEDIGRFEKVRLINAMIDLEDEIVIDTGELKY